MAWTYSGNPLGNPRDQVRLTIGDTEATDPQLQDGEIDYLLALSKGSTLRAAIRACDMLSARYARESGGTKSLGALSISGGTARGGEYRAMGAKLRAQAMARYGAPIYVGGRSWSEKLTALRNPDAVQPAFWRGQTDPPGTVRDDPWGWQGLGLPWRYVPL